MKQITRTTEIKTYRYEYVNLTDEQYDQWQKQGYSDESIFEIIEENDGVEIECIDDTERETTYTTTEVVG